MWRGGFVFCFLFFAGGRGWGIGGGINKGGEGGCERGVAGTTAATAATATATATTMEPHKTRNPNNPVYIA